MLARIFYNAHHGEAPPIQDNFAAGKKESRIFSIIFSFALTVVLLGVLAGQVSLFDSSGPVMLSGWQWKVVLLLLLFAYFSRIVIRFVLPSRFFTGSFTEPSEKRSLLPALKNLAESRVILQPGMFIALLLFLLLSDLPARRFGFWNSFDARWDWLYLGLIALMAILAFSRQEKQTLALRKIISPITLGVTQVLIIVLCYLLFKGHLIYSDDHPSFLYRIFLLREHFPRIPFYNTDWNAGYTSREFFPSGMLNVFLLIAPFVYFWSDWGSVEGVRWFSFIPAIVGVVIIPWSIYGAARLLKLSRAEAAAAALLAFAPVVSSFEWLIAYGTLGFMFSTAMAPLCFALVWRLTQSPIRPSWFIVPCLLVVSFMTISWTLTCLVFIPIAVSVLINHRQTFHRTRCLKVCFFILFFLLINVPWILIFFRESNVLTFIRGNTLPGSPVGSALVNVESKAATEYADSEKTGQVAGKQNSELTESQPIFSDFFRHTDRSLTRIRMGLTKVHPLVFCLFLPALLAFPKSRGGKVLSVTVLWLVLLAVLGEEIKPQLELRRMLVSACYLACVPVGSLLYRLARRSSMPARRKSISALLTLVLLLGGLFFSPVIALQALANRSDDHYRFADSTIGELARGIKQFGGEGRTFFSGFILHDLGASNYDSQDGGHIAPLPMWTGKQLYASDFYHARWSSVDPIPSAFRKRGSAGIEEFLDLINATAVVTHLKEWRDYFRKNSGYREVLSAGRFRVFVREHGMNNFFLSGSGKVERTTQGLRVVLDSREAVIKYRYFPRLKVESPDNEVEIYPVHVFTDELGAGRTQEISFIGLRVKSEKAVVAQEVQISF